MKKVLCALVLLALLWPSPALAESISEEEIDRLIGGMDFSAWPATDTPEHGKAMVERFASGDFSLNPEELTQWLWDALLGGMRNLLPTMAQIIILCVLCGVLLKMRDAFGGSQSAEIAEYACYLMAALPLAAGFRAALSTAAGALDAMTSFAQTLFPTLIALLAALGGSATSGVFEPAVMVTSSVLTGLVRGVLFTALVFCAALAILHRLSERVKIQGLYKFILTACSWGMGTAFTVFLGILLVQGAAASSFDGVTARTAKYAIDNLVPVVGGMFADTVDTLIGCALIVKNAVGLAGLVSVALLGLQPCMTLLGTALCYKLCAALLEPIADGRIVGLLGDFSKIMTLLFVAVLSVAAMFFVMITALVNAGAMVATIR